VSYSIAYPPRTRSTPGSDFVSSMLKVGPGDEHDRRVLAEVEAGNVPSHLSRLVPVEYRETIAGVEYTTRIFVAPDYFAIGTDDDYVRWPVGGDLAQRIADMIQAELPTPKIVTRIWIASKHLEPTPLTAGADMMSTAYFSRHHAAIEAQRVGTPWVDGELIAGVKKDIVRAHTLPRSYPGNVAIFGWHYPSGTPIQKLNPNGQELTHERRYRDYSHGVRFLASWVEIDTVTAHFGGDLPDLLMLSELTWLVNDAIVDGKPYPYEWRYPT
jgi:hypothetical protein